MPNVRHLIILIEFACLAVGMVCLARLVSLHRDERSERSRSRLVFFCAFSYLMAASTLFAYAAVNIGVGSFGDAILASFTFIGMAALELSLPRMVFADKGSVPPRSAMRLVAAGAALTAAQAASIWLLPDARTLSLILSFVPFGAVVAWVVVAGARSAPGDGGGRGVRLAFWPFGIAYGLILAGAVFEMRIALSVSDAKDYLPLSMPLAYLVSSLQFCLASSRRPAGAAAAASGGAGFSSPPALTLSHTLAEERRLSPREVEIADCILGGLGNKEIAARLGISENTARNHIYSLYQKLGIQKRMDLLGLVMAGRNEGGSTKIPPAPGDDK
jgi:DNA-binding CsgD family transcriptional regulator